MKRHHGLYILAALALAAFILGCSDKSTSLDVGVAPQPGTVGSQSCVNTCHSGTQDITGNAIAASWSDLENHHTHDAGVQCEDCHGGGGNHFGIGPIPFEEPRQAQCNACHGFTGFDATRHANGDSSPPPSFFQAGAGAGPGLEFGQPVAGLTQAEVIEQCSVCHNVNQRFVFNANGTLFDPDPAALPQPEVSCAGCHDAHFIAKDMLIPQRTEHVAYPIFRTYLVDNNPLSPTFGAQVFSPAAGVRYAGTLWQPNGAVDGLPAPATPDYARVVGTNNEIHPDRVCAPCHSKGAYKNSGNPTHAEDIHGQWSESGHGHREAPAFAEFSANPPAYLDASGNPYPVGTHRSTYPWDMALSSAGTTATTARNGSYIPAGSTSAANNYACFKCHHGLGSLAYQDNVEGTAAANVLFGDTTVTCVTCHDPHADVVAPAQTKNTRRPLVMTKYSGSINLPAGGTLTFSGNVFLDNTAVPAAAGNETICVFCHQGRESGFTLFRRRLTQDNATGSFINEHYLGTGGMLWGRNAYEYGGKLYGQNADHQSTNCNGCHMAAAPAGREDIGGHTWRIFAEVDNVVNNTTCNALICHAGEVPGTRAGLFTFRASFDTADYDGDGNVTEGIAQEVSDVAFHLLNLLQDNGVFYNDVAYPYFFRSLAFDPALDFRAWTRPNLKAAFNLQYVIKGLPSSAEGQVVRQNPPADNTAIAVRPNPSAATHNHRYNLQILIDSYTDLYNAMVADNVTIPPGRIAPTALFRPVGTRAAANYLPQAGGGYHPNQ